MTILLGILILTIVALVSRVLIMEEIISKKTFLNLLCIGFIGASLYGGYKTGFKASLSASTINPTVSIGQGNVYEFLQLCVEEPKATCLVTVADGETSFRLRYNYEGWEINSLTQARDILKAAKELERLKTK